VTRADSVMEFGFFLLSPHTGHGVVQLQESAGMRVKSTSSMLKLAV
jgi:hypothetical protein